MRTNYPKAKIDKTQHMLPTPSTIKFIQTKSFDIYIYTHIRIRILHSITLKWSICHKTQPSPT